MSERPVAVLLCSHLATGGHDLSLPALIDRLSSGASAISAAVVEELCLRPERIPAGVPREARGLVLGMCGREWRIGSAERVFRRLGIDPLGVESINLAATTALAPPARREEHASAQVLARVARAATFAGSRPEHVMPRVSRRSGRMSRRQLFTLPPLEHQPVAVLRRSQCASRDGCRQCVDACPRRAIATIGGEVVLDRQLCDSCGICIERCPRGAIDHARETPEGLDTELEALLRSAPAGEAPALLFVCRGDLDTVAAAGELPGGGGWWSLVEMPCTGAVSAALILRCVAAGAAAVAVAPCGPGCAFAVLGHVEMIVDYARSWLETVERQPDILQVASLTRLGELSLDANTAGSSGTLAAISAASAARRLGAFAVSPARLVHEASPFGTVEICETCTLCGVCVESCPSAALELSIEGDGTSLLFDPDRCNGCGICVARCPEADAGAIASQRATDLNALRTGVRVVREDRLHACEACGDTIGSSTMLRTIQARLGISANTALLEAITRRCPDCRVR